MRVKTLLRAAGATVDAATPVRDVAALMRGRGLSHVAVTDGGRLVGMLSDRDVRRAGASTLPVFARHESPVWFGRVVAREVMTKGTVTVPTTMSVADAVSVVVRDRLDAVAVMDGSHVAGVLTRDDLLDAAISALEAKGAARLSHILACPSDDDGARVIGVARALARRDGAALTALCVLPRSSHGLRHALELSLVEHVESAEWDIARLRLRSLLGEGPGRAEVVTGDFARQVRDVATRLEADLVVVDAREAARVNGDAPCPVLAVPGA